MTFPPVLYEDLVATEVTTYEQARSLQTNLVWKKLSELTVEEACSHWITTLGHNTRANYRSGMRKLAEYGLLNPRMSLQAFALINHEGILDRIKLVDDWSECTRQARAACYISFTAFLSRRLQGVVKKALPNREGAAKTFFKVRDKVKTSAMNRVQWLRFLEVLERINPRDCLIAKIILQGGKRVSEVLHLRTEQIDWDLRQITFTQSKTKGVHKETVITYPESLLVNLKQWIGDRKGYVFITRAAKQVVLKQLASTFAKAGKAAGIPFKVSPHVLRASTVTYLKQQGFPDSDIMGVTGHASSQMIYAYDKSARADNASRKVSLIV